MYHKGDIFSSFDSWWMRHEKKYEPYIINNLDFQNFPFHKGFNKGDILLITKAVPEKLKVGDIIIFEAGQNNPIIHRIINISKEDNKYFFSTIGDNNNGQLNVEQKINSEQLIGKASIKIVPFIGWFKLIFYEGTRSPEERGLCHENE